ncbi:MAG TPA: LCP family protein [Bacillota bacterium]|nr:LCP family protein [Bacillota bacterium]
MKRSELRAEKRKKRRWLRIPLIGIGIIFLALIAWGTYIFMEARNTVNEKMYTEIDSIDRDLSKKKVKAKDNLNILMLGIDSTTGDAGRSDSLIIVNLRPQEDKMKMISIPRDTRTVIAGRGYEDKINHAYAFGGAEMAIETVENFLGIEIDYHVRMNMQGLKELIDELGGITVTNDIEWGDSKYHFNKGSVELDGEKALAYVRMRKQDPEGDFGRAKRQRQVIEQIINKGANIATVTNITSTMDILGDNMETSLDFADMRRLLTGYSSTRNNVEQYQVQGSGAMIDGIYYYIVSEDEVRKVNGMLLN